MDNLFVLLWSNFHGCKHWDFCSHV